MTVPSLRNAGFSVGIFSGRAVFGCSSSATSVVAAAPRHRDRRDLRRERARGLRLARARQRGQRELVLGALVNWNSVAQSSAKVPISRPLS